MKVLTILSILALAFSAHERFIVAQNDTKTSARPSLSPSITPTPTPSPAPTEQAMSPSPTEQVITPVECGPRIRKSWDMLFPQEKDVYIRALQQSMDDGYYIKFVEIHTETMTTMEAHQTCMFLYWHRMLLLAFENMLRSYGGEFSCITIPYWNYADHNAAFMAGTCTSLEDCAPILQELGGSTRGIPRASITVNGTPIRGTVCVDSPPLDHFCEASHLTGPSCSRCLPRGDWTTAAFPPTVSMSSLLRQLFASQSIADVASNLEQGVHNTMHNALSGAMGNLEAPSDPIFWSHHATIDLLHSIYYHCSVGNVDPLPLEAKLADPRQFVQCARRTPIPGFRADRDVLLPQSPISARSGEEGVMPISVFDPRNVMSPFFAGLPTEYLSYSDVRDLGAFSYNYEMTGAFAEMFTTCANVNALVGATGFGLGLNAGLSAGLGRQLKQEAAKPQLLEAVIHRNASKASSHDWFHAALVAAINATSSPGSDMTTQLTNALTEVEKMTCLFYEECRGPVQDFSMAFQSHFHMHNTSTPCRQVIDAIARGDDHIRVNNWKDVMTQYLRCD